MRSNSNFAHHTGLALSAIGMLAAVSLAFTDTADAAGMGHASGGFAAAGAAPMSAPPMSAPAHAFAPTSLPHAGSSIHAFSPQSAFGHQAAPPTMPSHMMPSANLPHAAQLGTQQLGQPSIAPPLPGQQSGGTTTTLPSTASTIPLPPVPGIPTSGASAAAEQQDLSAILSISRLPPAPAPRVQDPPPGATATTTSTTGGSLLSSSTTPAFPTGPDTNIVELSSGGSAGVSTQNIAFGGGGPTLTDCMSLWDKSTDMTKVEWKDTCVRTMNGTNLTPEDLSHVADVSRIIGDSEQGVPGTHAAKHSTQASHRNGHKDVTAQKAKAGGTQRADNGVQLH